MGNYTLKYTGTEVDGLLEKIDTAFGEETVMGDTLTWDGNTDGLYCVADMFYCVSDVVPTLEDLRKGGSLVYDSSIYTFTSANVMNLSDLGAGKDCVIIAVSPDVNGYMAGVALKAGATAYLGGASITFEKAGVYLRKGSMGHTSPLVINDYTGFEMEKVTTMNPKYLSYNMINILWEPDENGVLHTIADKTYDEIIDMLSKGIYPIAHTRSENTEFYASIVGVFDSGIRFSSIVEELNITYGMMVKITSDNVVSVDMHY